MIDLDKKFFETERLILRPFLEGDLEDLYEYASVPEIAEMAGWKHHESMEDSEIILNMLMRAKNVYAIVLKEEAKVIGSLGLMHNGDGIELGHVLNVNYWGRGIEKEAFAEIIDYCFNELGVEEVYRGYYEAYEVVDSINDDFEFEFVKKSKHHTLGLGDKERVLTVLRRPADFELKNYEEPELAIEISEEIELDATVESTEEVHAEEPVASEEEVQVEEQVLSEETFASLDASYDDDYFDLHAKIDTLLYSFIDIKKKEEEIEERIKFMLEKENAIAERLVQIEKKEKEFLNKIDALEKKENDLKERIAKLEQGQKVVSVHTAASYTDDFVPSSTPLSSGAVALSASPMTMTYGSNGFRIITNPNPIKSAEPSLSMRPSVEAEELMIEEPVFEEEELPTVDKVLAASEAGEKAFDTDKILMSEENLEHEIDDLTDRLSKRYDGASVSGTLELKFRRVSSNKNLEKLAKSLYCSSLAKPERLPFRLLVSKAKTKRADFLAVYNGAEMIGLTYVIYHRNTALVLFNISVAGVDFLTYEKSVIDRLKSIYGKKNLLIMFKSDGLAKLRRELAAKQGFGESSQLLRRNDINYEFVFLGRDTSSLELSNVFKKYFGSLRHIFKYEI